MKQVIQEQGSRPIKIWTEEVEETALQQLKNLSRLPFINSNGVACMPDVHAGIGSTVGTVIATEKAVIPAAVGVDIGCGMNAVRLSLKASDLPDNLKPLRDEIEKRVPLGVGGGHDHMRAVQFDLLNHGDMENLFNTVVDPLYKGDWDKFTVKAASQLGTLGSGNHFIEICIDESQDVWIMLHSGSRGIGNMIGSHYIEIAKREMEKFFISLPDDNLAYFPEGTEHFDDYMASVGWAQNYALENRRLMMIEVIEAMKQSIAKPFTITQEAINCHHNYVEKENHFGRNMWVTRKGAIRARAGDLGIIPGSMGQRSYIVRGKGDLQSYCSCSHGAGRVMSRAEAKRRFSLTDLIAQTEGVECRKDEAVIDEIPASYKDIDQVMANQTDLVEVVHTLKQVLCVKGN
jgi:tRNA-splicing ligase RtcB